MAIFSLRHTWLGKSHAAYKPGVGRAHANYVTRQSSCRKVIGARAPIERNALKGWLNSQEMSDRKNARIIDKVMVALPVELTDDQREALVKDFCERVTQGRASWVAAFHDRGKDAHNPHAHIILRDRDIDTGKRVILTTELGSTERLRREWEQVTNRALKAAGLNITVDRRSLAAQGIDRKAEEHHGPQKTNAKDRSGQTAKPHDPAAPLVRQPAASPEQDMRAEPDRSPADEKEGRRTKERPAAESDHAWTGRGGMVAQQWSAMHWAMAADEARMAHEAAPAGPAVGAATVSDSPVADTKPDEGPRPGHADAKSGLGRPRFRVQLSEEQKGELDRSVPTGRSRGGLGR